MHAHNSQRVEALMTASGETVRHQPVASIPTYELARRYDAIVHSLELLTTASGLTTFGSLRIRYHLKDSTFDRAEVLTHLAELQFQLFCLHHTFGTAHLADSAFDELLSAKLTELWPDGNIHHTDSTILYPPTRRLPDMRPILAAADASHEAVQTKLFAEPPPSDIIEDTNESRPL